MSYLLYFAVLHTVQLDSFRAHPKIVNVFPTMLRTRNTRVNWVDKSANRVYFSDRVNSANGVYEGIMAIRADDVLK